MNYECDDFKMTVAKQNAYHQYPHVKLVVNHGAQRERLLALFEGVTGREFTRIDSHEYMQPERARKLVDLFNAGFEYCPTAFAHYFRQSGQSRMTLGQAWAASKQMITA